MVQTTTTGTNSITYTDSVQNCGYRLPCGYCKMLDKACPMGWVKYDITCDSIGDAHMAYTDRTRNEN